MRCICSDKTLLTNVPEDERWALKFLEAFEAWHKIVMNGKDNRTSHQHKWIKKFIEIKLVRKRVGK